jgi:predicted component of type VI protein secretion system
LQLQDADGLWHDLEQVRHGQSAFGRDNLSDLLPCVDFLAPEHLLIVNSDDGLFVEGSPTLNGFYQKLPPGRPVELVSGSRFQVGSHVIEFRLPEPADESPALQSEDGEVFVSRALAPLAFLDFIGPDSKPSLSVPLTKLDFTVLGREGGAHCDIGLAGDPKTSGRHARIVREGGRFLLEDLNSTNGTFLQVNGRTPLRPGREQDPNSGDVLAVGEVLLRVVER